MMDRLLLNTMAKNCAEGASIRRQRRIGFTNALRSGRGDRSTYRLARITLRATQITPTIATTQGARNAIATPIIRKLHIIAFAL